MNSEQDNRSDADLVLAVRADSREAREVLVNRHLPSVYAVAFRIAGQSCDAEDISQDSFVRAFEKLEQYDLGRSFRNWLLKIATNLAIDHVRSRKRLRVVDLEPEQAFGWREREDSGPEVQRLLGRLDEGQRAAIALFHFEELSYDQVAEAMGVPINTVRTLLHRGRRRLGELIQREKAMEDRAWTAARRKA